MAGITLDAGGLIALDRDDRRVVVLLARARPLRIDPRGDAAEQNRQYESGP